VELSARYINDRKLPDKAIDVIDETGASQMLLPEAKRKKTIGIKEVEATIATMARIPPKTVSKDDAEVLEHLTETLERVVYGQNDAIVALTAAIKLARAGLRDGEKPIGSYLFSGPTGVGKTEVARQLAVSLGVELVRFDMSNIWSATLSQGLSARLRAMSASTRGACSPMRSTSILIVSCFSMRSKRRIPIFIIFCCRSWITESSPITAARPSISGTSF